MVDRLEQAPVFEISRSAVEEEIELLISLLDILDVDTDIEIDADFEGDNPDDEPLHGAPEQQAGSWKGIEALAGCAEGQELELGWTELEARFGRYSAAGNDVYEPSLGSKSVINQTKWSKSTTDDREEEHDGREPDRDYESQEHF